MNPSPPESPAPAALLSFPKTGRTWLKLMLKFYFERLSGIEDLPFDRPHDWHAIDPRLPGLLIEHDDNPHFKRPEDLETGRDRYASRNVILLARDPRDVMVSLYFEMTRRIRFYEEWGFDTTSVRDRTESLSDFIRGPVGRLDSFIAYYDIWQRQRDRMRDFLLVRYEAMHENPQDTLTRVVDFLGLAVDPGAAAHAVDQCQFDRMRDYEARGVFRSKTLMPGDPSDPDSFKVRRGRVGGYVDYLSGEDLRFIREQCKRLPDLLARYRR